MPGLILHRPLLSSWSSTTLPPATCSTVTEGFAGDVIGLTNPGAFAIGDTLCTVCG
jgi:peptide subunit release factor RF-3